MQLWNLTISLIEKFTVRQFQEINRLNEKYNNWGIDSTTLSNELCKITIQNINWETDKQKIENQISDMGNIQDYAKLNEEIAKKINNQISWIKKRARIRIF